MDLKFSSTFCPQKDDQTEVLNKSFENILCAQVIILDMWGTLPLNIEFEYNYSVNWADSGF
jgi:hypothetical protein